MGTEVKVKGIASFPNVLKPVKKSKESRPDDPKVFQISLLIPKGDPQIAYLQQIIEQERNSGPSGRQTPCLKDGASDDYYSKDPIHHGYMVFSANVSENYPPVVIVGPQGQDFDKANPGHLNAGRAGMMATVNATIHPYEAGKGGVRAGLQGVWFTGEDSGVKLGVKPKSANDLFGVGSESRPGVTVAKSAPAPASSGAPLMSPTAQYSYEQYIQAGWTDYQLVQQGLMVRNAPNQLVQ